MHIGALPAQPALLLQTPPPLGPDGRARTSTAASRADRARGAGRGARDPGSSRRPGAVLAAYGIPVVPTAGRRRRRRGGGRGGADRRSGRAQDPLARHHPQERCRRRRAQSRSREQAVADAARGDAGTRRARGAQGAARRLPGAADGPAAGRDRADPRASAEDPVFGPVVLFGAGRHGGRGDRRHGARPAAAQSRCWRGRRSSARGSSACCGLSRSAAGRDLDAMRRAPWSGSRSSSPTMRRDRRARHQSAARRRRTA